MTGSKIIVVTYNSVGGHRYIIHKLRTYKKFNCEVYRMKITCNRRDDIIKRRDEYEADYAAKRERHEAQREAFYRAERDVTSLIEEEVGAQLNRFSALNFRIRASRGSWESGGMSIRIQCNENEMFNDDVALAWSLNVELDKDGKVTKESSSWSGLKATTPAQLESLSQTLEALKYLNSVQWDVVLNKEMPNYDDYFTEPSPSRRNRPNFEQELVEADLEDAVGTNKLVRGKATNATGYSGEGYYLLLKETPAQYVGIFVPTYYVTSWLSKMTMDEVISKIKKQWSPCRIAKNKITEIFGKEVKFYQEGQD